MKKIYLYIKSFLLLLLCAQSAEIFSAAAATETDSESDSGDFLDAVEQGNFEKVQDFLAKGVHVETKDKDSGTTALMHAVYHGRIDIVDTLCMNKADINSKDKSGDTPLIFAAYLGKAPILKYLLTLGADYSLRNNKGEGLENIFAHADQCDSSSNSNSKAKQKALERHKWDILQLVLSYKQIDTTRLQKLKLAFPLKEYPGTAEEQLICHQRDIVPLKKVLFVLELENIVNERNLLPIMADYLAPFLEEENP